MDLESVKRYLEKGGEGDKHGSLIEGLPSRFFETLIVQGLHVDVIEPSRVVCSMKVPSRLLNGGNYLHGGATAMLVDLMGSAAIYASGASLTGERPATGGVPLTGVSVEINVSYLEAAYINEEIEIEAKNLRVGKAVGVVSVEFRKKKTGKIIAQGRHTKYLPMISKL